MQPILALRSLRYAPWKSREIWNLRSFGATQFRHSEIKITMQPRRIKQELKIGNVKTPPTLKENGSPCFFDEFKEVPAALKKVRRSLTGF